MEKREKKNIKNDINLKTWTVRIFIYWQVMLNVIDEYHFVLDSNENKKLK